MNGTRLRASRLATWPALFAVCVLVVVACRPTATPTEAPASAAAASPVASAAPSPVASLQADRSA